MPDKKVLFVIPYMHEGGAQRALSNIQKQLAENEDIEIDTLLNSEINRAYPNSGGVISLHIDKKPRTGSVLFQFIAFVKRVKKLRELKNSGQYSTCISFVDSANIANVISTIFGKKTKIKTVVSVRVSISETAQKQAQYRYVVKPLAKAVYKKADLVVSVSEELKHELIRDFGLDEGKVTTIPNGFDLNDIIVQSEENIPDSIGERIKGKKVIFTAGRLHAVKNQWHLIRAFSAVKSKIPDSLLVIAGSGELDSYLKSVAENMGIADDVIFLGFEKNVYRYMRLADAFVLPSRCEGFPNSLGEALCSGAPCIATDFKTGAREILAPDMLLNGEIIEKATECEFGILTPVCSGRMYNGSEPLEHGETELAGAMIRMLCEDVLNAKYRDRSMQRASELDIKYVIDKWISVIEKDKL